MSDLPSGRYADVNPEWLLDGQPAGTYRSSVPRALVGSTAVTGAATQIPYVTAVPVLPGDVFNFVSFSIGTLAGTANATSFVVVYSAVPTAAAAATVLGVSAVTTFVANANKIALTGAVAVGSSPAVYGVAIVEDWTTTGSQFDCVAGGKFAFKGQLTGQLPLVTKLPTLAGAPPAVGSSSGVTITAPTVGLIPYIVLSRT